MNKVEILEVVKEMQVDWQLAVNGRIKDNCAFGFCHWLTMNPVFTSYYVIDELRKENEGNVHGFYWYGLYGYGNKHRIVFTTRLNHLNRTIARLENELNPDHNATI